MKQFMHSNVPSESKTPRGDVCWSQHDHINLIIRKANSDATERCNYRYSDLNSAKAACIGSQRGWCGGITRDTGIVCATSKSKLRFELRSAEIDAEDVGFATSWLHHLRPADGGSCPRTLRRFAKRRHATSERLPRRFNPPEKMGAPPSGEVDDRLGELLRAHLQIALERARRGPPAYERFPDLAFRNRDWGPQTRHGRGDAYPLYTQDTMRNIADHLFDASTGWAVAATQGPKVKACDLVYSTLRPTKDFLHHVHRRIRVPYMLISDTADEPITHYHAVDALLHSQTLRHWWAVDNEVLDSPKMSSVPLGVMDSFEIGVKGKPQTVTFDANIGSYLGTILAAQSQPKTLWLMMQMSITHPERRRVRAMFKAGWGSAGIRLTPEMPTEMNVREYLMQLGKHRFVLSPRGNGLDAHRTWEALLVGAIPIVRSSALNPLYSQLPVLIVRDWSDVSPQLLQSFLTNFSIRKPLYHYEKLFADYWLGQIAVQRERCLADLRASRAPNYTYDYNAPGGWAPVDSKGRLRPPPRWAADAAKGG